MHRPNPLRAKRAPQCDIERLQPHEVIAVMRSGFSFPEATQIWKAMKPAGIPPDILYYGGMIGRLRAGRTVLDARAEVELLVERLKASYSSFNTTSYSVQSLHDHLRRPLRRPVLIFQGAALLVLLVACANVAALQLARGVARGREFAVRAALGARRFSLAGLVLIESIALAVVGGAAGTALALAGMRMLVAWFPDGVPSYIHLTAGAPVFAVALAATLLAALTFGLAPALRAAKSRAPLALDGSMRSAGASSAARGRFRDALVLFDVAVSIVLAAGSVLLIRSDRATRRSLGFEPAGVISVRVPLPYDRYRG